jgi:Family of unknown function (DUF6589)
VECSSNKRLNYIEAMTGFFHMEIAALVMLFRSHAGSEKEPGTIPYWIRLLQRNQNLLWDGTKHMVKDFRACFELIGQIVDGYLLGILAKRSGWEKGAIGASFESNLDIRGTIEAVAADLTNFKQTDARRADAAPRDHSFDNTILLLQHGLVLRNMHHAMAHGDVGRLLMSFRHLTCWFQSSRQFNYAQETIHLTACLAKIWSPEFKQFMLSQCLVNVSGKPDSFYPTDLLNEYIVREVKKMMVHNATPQTDRFLREVISPQVMFNMRLKMKMAEESDATYIFDYHHQDVDVSADIDTIANDCLRRNSFEHVIGREPAVKEVPDLLVAGIKELSATKRILEYKERVAAMGIRGVVELSRRSESMSRRPASDAEGSNEDSDDSGEDDNVPIETESLRGGPEDDLDEWA